MRDGRLNTMATMYDVAGVVRRDPLVCRVFGLTSDTGKLLNGLGGKVISISDPRQARSEDRLPVKLDGIPEPKSLKRANLDIAPEGTHEYGVGVGREEMQGFRCDPTQPALDELFLNVVDRRSGQQMHGADVPDEATAVCGRAYGALQAVNFILGTLLNGPPPLTEQQAPQLLRNMPGISFWMTDLNVCRAFNLAAGGEGGVAPPHAVLAAPLESMVRLIDRLTLLGMKLYAVFDPHRCTPDTHEDVGTQRLSAALAGHAAIYPSANPRRSGCVEVRFTGQPRAGTTSWLTSQHERFIDYGEGEVLAYVRFAAALGDIGRLQPLTLARTDPQCFWAAALRIEHVISTLAEMTGGTGVAAEWQPLVEGLHHCADNLAQHAPPEWRGWDAAGTWGQHLHSADVHEQVAEAGALGGLLLSLDSQRDGARVKLNCLDDVQGTNIGKLFDTFIRVQQLEAKAAPGGDPSQLSHEKRARLFNEALKGQGWGDDPLDLNNDPLHACGHCGARGGTLRKCTGCGGAVYCNAECQGKAWPRHKKQCSKQLALMRKALRQLDQTQPREVRMGMPMPGESAAWREKSFITSEATGVGAVGLHHNPGFISSLTFWDGAPEPVYDATLAEVAAVGHAQKYDQGLGTRQHFRTLTDLDAPLQLLLACGPLVDLPRAQALLPEVLSLLPPPGITALRLHDVLFTPLEWAAKKGNLAVVEWLCTDARTQPLVRVGAPVGWACYTGKLEVARALLRHGADAGATHEALWGGLPPLLVAAQNGQLQTVQWLMDEAGQQLAIEDSRGFGVLHHITLPQNWQRLTHADCKRWAERRLAEFKAAEQTKEAPPTAELVAAEKASPLPGPAARMPTHERWHHFAALTAVVCLAMAMFAAWVSSSSPPRESLILEDGS